MRHRGKNVSTLICPLSTYSINAKVKSLMSNPSAKAYLLKERNCQNRWAGEQATGRVG